MIFGVLISIAGVIGTPLGGFVLDKMINDSKTNTMHSHIAKIGELIYQHRHTILIKMIECT